MIVGAFGGLAVGLRLAAGDLTSVLAMALLAAALYPLARLLAPTEARRELLMLLAVAFALRAAASAAFYTASIAAGRNGAVTGDDIGYVALIWAYAQHIRGDELPAFGPPSWGGNAYLFGTFVYLQSVVFAVVGFHPLVGALVNAWLGTAAVALVWDVARRLFGRGAANASAVVLVISPGLIGYCAVMLKEAVALLITALVLWLVIRFQERPRAIVLALAYLLLELLHSVRQYVFLGITIVIPLSVAVTDELRGRSRALWLAAAASGSILVIAFNAAMSGDPQVPQRPLFEFERVRQAMATGRTAFVISTQVPTSAPTTFPTSAPTTAPTEEPTTVPGIVGGRPTTVPTTRPTTRPTSAPTTAPTTVPTTRPTTVPLREGPPPDPADDAATFRRTLAYLPTGITYVLLAPFPWATKQLQDWLVLPDTLLWYLVASCAAWSAWRARASWRRYAVLAGFTGGMLLVLALFEGNVGTLHRHRAITVFPFAAALAGPALASLWRLSRRRGRTGAPAPSRR